MSDIKELFNEALKFKDSTEIFENWCDILDYYLGIFKSECKESYNDLMCELYVSVHGEHLSEKMAKKYVAKMKNENGTTGETWSIHECDKMAQENGIKYDSFNVYDWYYVLNMLYSDFYKVLGDNIDLYIKMAYSWLHDADVPQGKAFRYATKVV